MATAAERMRAHRERARRGLRRFTISASADDLRVIAEHGYEGAASADQDCRSQAIGHFISDTVPVSTATGDSVTQRCCSVAVTPSLRSDTVTLPCRSWALTGSTVARARARSRRLPCSSYPKATSTDSARASEALVLFIGDTIACLEPEVTASRNDVARSRDSVTRHLASGAGPAWASPAWPADA